MKKKLNKILLIVLILLIISGIIILGVKGFNKSPEYIAGTKIEVHIAKGYNKNDIVNIAKECFTNKDIYFEDIEKLNQVASIKVKAYTEEELNSYKAKISEKYDIEEDSLQLYEIPVPTTQIRTVIMPYVFPVMLVTVISLIYVLFRNLKSKDKWKNILKILLVLAIVLGVYFSLILVLRLPFGTYTMPMALAIYILTLIILGNNMKK